MTRLLAPLAVACVAGAVLAAPVPKPGGPTYLDLQPKGTQKLTDDVGGLFPNNTLAPVPTGEREFAGVKFRVGEKLIQLGSPILKDPKPDAVEGIAVGRAVGKLHFLHAALFGKSQPKIEDGTTIAEYRVRYDDGIKVVVPVKYGVDVRDWWYPKAGPEPAGDKVRVAWEGENEASKTIDNGVRLYLTTWENPHPAKRVKAIEFARVEGTQASPFCVAITAE